MRLPLKIAIISSGRSQRDIGLDVRISEGRLSDIVRGRVDPTATERQQRQRVLGSDPFVGEVVKPEASWSWESPARRYSGGQRHSREGLANYQRRLRDVVVAGDDGGVKGAGRDGHRTHQAAASAVSSSTR